MMVSRADAIAVLDLKVCGCCADTVPQAQADLYLKAYVRVGADRSPNVRTNVVGRRKKSTTAERLLSRLPIGALSQRAQHDPKSSKAAGTKSGTDDSFPDQRNSFGESANGGPD